MPVLVDLGVDKPRVFFLVPWVIRISGRLLIPLSRAWMLLDFHRILVYIPLDALQR
jgi:hypothetical protein